MFRRFGISFFCFGLFGVLAMMLYFLHNCWCGYSLSHFARLQTSVGPGLRTLGMNNNVFTCNSASGKGCSPCEVCFVFPRQGMGVHLVGMLNFATDAAWWKDLLQGAVVWVKMEGASPAQTFGVDVCFPTSATMVEVRAGLKAFKCALDYNVQEVYLHRLCALYSRALESCQACTRLFWIFVVCVFLLIMLQ